MLEIELMQRDEIVQPFEAWKNKEEKNVKTTQRRKTTDV